MKRFAILYTEPGSYTHSCLAALRDIYNCEILAITYPTAKNAPFESNPLFGMGELFDRNSFQSSAEIATKVLDFQPDAVYVSGWSDKQYLQTARIIKKSGVPVISGLDTQFYGRLRQHFGTWMSRYYLKNAFDVLWVPGERQAAYAARLGYRGNRCWQGLYCCDWVKYDLARRNVIAQKNQFLFGGRYIESKGIDVLLDAYAQYRKAVSNPWNLVCAGAGPIKPHFDGIEGIQDLGFVQPRDLPAIMAESGAFVLPSRNEPWGVVVQEAAAAGLPLICSDAVGAAVHLLQDYFNGFLFRTGDVHHLVDRMIALSNMSENRRKLMGQNSHELSKQFMPERWAETLVKETAKFRAGAISNSLRV